MSNTLKLRDYQEEISDKAVELLKKYKIAYLAMQVRTGKTLTAIATAHKFGAKSVLFVTKKKAIGDIVKQFSGSNIKMGIYVTNFEQLGNVKESFDLIIIDEAHSLAAFPLPSSRAKELKRICFGSSTMTVPLNIWCSFCINFTAVSASTTSPSLLVIILSIRSLSANL